jgi:predicted molibdopterin-dependent oxidoreductase YjgC
MFKQRPEARPSADDVEVSVDGVGLRVPAGASAAAAVLLAGGPAIRTTPVSNAPRLPYCMMGVCFECLAEIDGVPNRQACMVAVAPGMRIVRQQGARVHRTKAA